MHDEKIDKKRSGVKHCFIEDAKFFARGFFFGFNASPKRMMFVGKFLKVGIRGYARFLVVHKYARVLIALKTIPLKIFP